MSISLFKRLQKINILQPRASYLHCKMGGRNVGRFPDNRKIVLPKCVSGDSSCNLQKHRYTQMLKYTQISLSCQYSSMFAHNDVVLITNPIIYSTIS